MTEPTVQVPVSLATRLLEGKETVADLRNLRALLSQSTPTAEPASYPDVWNAAIDRAQEELVRQDQFSERTLRILDEQRIPSALPTAEPPRIEDMAPGTTFRGRSARYGDRTWQIKSAGLVWDDVQNFGLRPSAIDPSTIRDVTPPKDAA